MAREQHNGAFVFGAILGGLAGAVVTLLRAPQSGTETRAELAAQADALVVRANEALTERFDGLRRRGDDETSPFAVLKRRDEEPFEQGNRVELTPDAGVRPAVGTVLLLPDPLEADPIVEPIRLDDRADGNR